MNLANLLEKLLEIERALGVESDSVVRRKMQDVQDCVLQMQKERAVRIQREHQFRAA